MVFNYFDTLEKISSQSLWCLVVGPNSGFDSVYIVRWWWIFFSTQELSWNVIMTINWCNSQFQNAMEAFWKPLVKPRDVQ